MKRTLLINITILLAILIPAAGILAQGQQVRERLQSQLERTEEILVRAREMVQSTKSSQAKVAYDDARRLQDMAMDQFRQGPGGQHWEMAAKLTMQARQRAQTALTAARTSEQNETALVRLLERTEEMLQRARGLIGETDIDALPTLYQSAKNNLDRAWEFYRDGQYRASLKIANQVERAAEKLLQQANRTARSEDNFQRRREQVGNAFALYQGRLDDCDSGTAARLMEQARAALQTAERFANEGNLQAANNALQQCYKLALQAGRLCGGAADLQLRYERLQDRADRLAEDIAPGDDQAARLLSQAREQLDLARDYLGNQQSEAGGAALKAAQLALNELQRHLERGRN